MPPNARSAWIRTLGQLGLVLVAALLAGLVLGQVGLALAIAALGVVAWHYWRLRRLLARLGSRQRMPEARGEGAWNELERRCAATRRACVRAGATWFRCCAPTAPSPRRCPMR